MIELQSLCYYFYSLACQCANLTSQKGYKVFGLQFYGECWSAPNGLNTYDKHNTADDEKCVMEIDWNAGAWVHCDIASDEACVGKDNTNYIYILEEGVCLKYMWHNTQNQHGEPYDFCTSNVMTSDFFHFTGRGQL